jgi:hypothetical protein
MKKLLDLIIKIENNTQVFRALTDKEVMKIVFEFQASRGNIFWKVKPTPDAGLPIAKGA